MKRKYKKEIEQSWACTRTYDNFKLSDRDISNFELSNCKVICTDTTSAILKYVTDGAKVAALNFASFKKPGGMFLAGSKAQEEMLCHESTLYNILDKMKEYYTINLAGGTNKHLYRNRALYSPDVIFERDGKAVKCDVITCAAPNYRAAKEYMKVTPEQNLVELEKRIKFVLDIAEDNNVEVLILGAFGCGVFRQDPTEVANTFAKQLESGGYNFKQVIFAIPDCNSANYNEFVTVFDPSLLGIQEVQSMDKLKVKLGAAEIELSVAEAQVVSNALRRYNLLEFFGENYKVPTGGFTNIVDDIIELMDKNDITESEAITEVVRKFNLESRVDQFVTFSKEVSGMIDKIAGGIESAGEFWIILAVIGLLIAAGWGKKN